MKIGLLTFHNAHNYGAVLQTYALKEKIKKMGYNIEVVNYRNPSIENDYDIDLAKAMAIKKSYFRHPKFLLSKIREYCELEYRKDSYDDKYRKFSMFIQKYLLGDKDEVIESKSMETLDYDVFIVGSDQIWNGWLTGGLDSVYLLDFNTKAKKIAYSASRGNTPIKDKDMNYIRKCVSEFDGVSVRESSLKDELEQSEKLNVCVTVDPTLLLCSNDYNQIISSTNLESEKYIFAYFVYENDAMMKCAEYIADKMGLKLVELHYFMHKKYKSHNQRADLGPEEFLWYIKNAELVITNSFHGTVFSILFHKRFYSVYEYDVRIDNLLKILHMENLHVTKPDEMKEIIIDYNMVDKLLEKAKKDSVDFLENTLNK